MKYNKTNIHEATCKMNLCISLCLTVPSKYSSKYNSISSFDCGFPGLNRNVLLPCTSK